MGVLGVRGSGVDVLGVGKGGGGDWMGGFGIF